MLEDTNSLDGAHYDVLVHVIDHLEDLTKFKREHFAGATSFNK